MSKVPLDEWVYPKTYEELIDKIYETYESKVIKIRIISCNFIKEITNQLSENGLIIVNIYRYNLKIYIYDDEGDLVVNTENISIDAIIKGYNYEKILKKIRKNQLLYHYCIPKKYFND